jgi:N-acetylmuramoyl-L-alanine amidase
MKKAIAMIVSIVFIFSASAASFAASVSLASLKSIKYSRSGAQDKISIYTSNYKGYTVTWVKNPDRLVIDIPNNKVTVQGKQTIAVNGQSVSSIRFSQFTKTTARVVFDTKGKVPYSISAANGSLTFTLGNSSTASRGDAEERPALPDRQLSVSSADEGDRIVIPGSNHDGYNIFRLTDPDRVVMDVPNLMLSADQELLNVNGKFVNTIRTSPVDSTTTRVVMDTSGQPQYRLENTPDGLAVIFDEPAIENLAYHNNGNGISLLLDVAMLTEVAPPDPIFGAVNATAEEAGNLRKLYSESYDETGMRYTMTFPQNLAKIGSGTLRINDGVIDSVEVKNDAANGTTSIVFNAKSRFVYEAITNLDTYTTEIHILKPFNAADRLVVIDPGHGGSDPGAQYEGLLEKDLNLKIALKVNEILESRGVKTYMTRDDDTFIPLHTRADMANNLNASLFLSIHNNAFNSVEHGTETLYYPGATGSSFARIVQDTLVSALGTKDRGIVERPNLVVLNATKMPAVIAEVAFLTNTEDRALLMDDSFIQKAAEALADAVVKALE